MYFLVNTAFVNYLCNLTDSMKFPVLLNQVTHEQTLPISLQSFDFDPDFLKTPKTLKDFLHQFWHKKEIFDLHKRHNNGLDLATNDSFFNNFTIDVFLFVTAILLLVVTSIVMYIMGKHTKLNKRSRCCSQTGPCLCNT